MVEEEFKPSLSVTAGPEVSGMCLAQFWTLQNGPWKRGWRWRWPAENLRENWGRGWEEATLKIIHPVRDDSTLLAALLQLDPRNAFIPLGFQGEQSLEPLGLPSSAQPLCWVLRTSVSCLPILSPFISWLGWALFTASWVPPWAGLPGGVSLRRLQSVRISVFHRDWLIACVEFYLWNLFSPTC